MKREKMTITGNFGGYDSIEVDVTQDGNEVHFCLYGCTPDLESEEDGAGDIRTLLGMRKIVLE